MGQCGFGVSRRDHLFGRGQFRLSLLEGFDEGFEFRFAVAQDPLAAIVDGPPVVLLVPGA